MASEVRILTINPGSTSTKIAIFEGDTILAREELFLDTDVISSMPSIIDQLPFRTEQVKTFIQKSGIKSSAFDIIVARGGPLTPCKHNCYYVNQLMRDTMTYKPKVQHASALACLIGWELAKEHQIPVIIYDPTATDEFDDISRITGIPQISIAAVSHLLNTRMVAREKAGELGIKYEEGRFIVAHLGGGISINAHRNGRVVDACYDDMGPLSPQRVGRIPTRYFNDLRVMFTPEEMEALLMGKGGLVAWFGTQDMRVVERMMEEGNEQARLVYDAMALGVAKGICEMAAVLSGQVDAILLTGGLARGKRFTDAISRRVSFVAPVTVVPGEREMEALCRGGLRVLSGEEKAWEFDLVPYGFQTVAQFYQWMEQNGYKPVA